MQRQSHAGSVGSLHARGSAGAGGGRAARAFTIAELMIVLIILGVVLSVILPSIKHVNQRAKAAVTASIISSVANAGGQFANDHTGRNPGRFTAAQMGSDRNLDRGLSGMQNILLDLMAGVTVKAATPGTGVYELDPADLPVDERVRVDLTQLAGSTLAVPGGAARSYYRPDPKYYYAALEEGQTATSTNPQHMASVAGHLFLPDLHDAYGTPMLAWQEDERAQGAPTAVFAAEDSTDEIARFYWVSNACFLRSPALGKLMQNQATQSMIGSGPPALTGLYLDDTLRAILGNPAFPEAGTGARARGPIIYHSAGANGIFVGRDERGAKIATATSPTNPLPYFPGVDPMKNGDFDDIVVGSGN